MLRVVLVALVGVGCGASARVEAPQPPISLADTPPALVVGERTTWNVFWRGVAVGRADLAIESRRPGEHAARSAFRTTSLASAFASIRYDLVTAFAGDLVTALDEQLQMDRQDTVVRARVTGADFTLADGSAHRVPDGTQLHSLHSALAVLRSWSRHKPKAGFLWVLHQGELYRLDVFRPVRDEALAIRALRIDGIVRAAADTGRPTGIPVSLWLAANRDRTPLRFTVGDVSAEVIESTASFETR